MQMKIKLLLILMLCAASFSRVSAQTQSNRWNTLFVEYNSISYLVDIANTDDESLTGISAGYSQFVPISPESPMCVEIGGAVQYAFKQDFYDKDDTDINLFSVRVPLNLAYAFELPNSSILFIPFAGVSGRFNFAGNVKYTGGTKDQDWNLFDKKDMKELRLTTDLKPFNRFQFGWQLGAKVKLGESFLIGLAYGSDMSELAKKVTLSTLTFSAAYMF